MTRCWATPTSSQAIVSVCTLPRFAAVRKVYGIVENDYQEHIASLENPVPPLGLGDVQIATTAIQPVQPELNLGTAHSAWWTCYVALRSVSYC